MADERRAHPEYGEDVDDMALEHLIYNATKACIHEFFERTGTSENARPTPGMATEVHLLNDFMRIHWAKYQDKQLSDDHRLWLELLALVLFIAYRHTDTMLLLTSASPPRSRPLQLTDRLLGQRRRHWIQARTRLSAVSNAEARIYQAWGDVSIGPSLQSLDRLRPVPPRTIEAIVPLFMTVSAKNPHFLDQGIDEEWADLAGQMLLQAAVELCLGQQGGGNRSNLLIYAFAWGWIPLEYWDEYEERNPDDAMDNETIINDMLEATVRTEGSDGRESSTWQRIRFRYLSLFGMTLSSDVSRGEMAASQLRHVIQQYPIQQFESRLMVYLKELWSELRKPVLVQIEDGYIDGLTDAQFEDFRGRVFLPD